MISSKWAAWVVKVDPATSIPHVEFCIYWLSLYLDSDQYSINPEKP